MSGEGITDDINSSIGIVEKKISINFSKGKTKFSSLQWCNSSLYVNI